MFQKFKDFIKKYRLESLVDVAIFGIITVVFHWLWWHGGVKEFLLEYTGFHDLELFMARQVFLPSAWFVEHVIGYDINTYDTTLYFLPNKGSIMVNGSCSGLKQFYQWIFLMLLFPGPWKKKLWFIPLGLLVIHLNNILRIIILSVILVHWPQQWHFSHDWILRPFFYVVIFGMWVLWVEKIRGKKYGGSGKKKTG